MKMFEHQQKEGTQPLIVPNTIPNADMSLFAKRNYVPNEFIC
jgi:hypothetical protein